MGYIKDYLYYNEGNECPKPFHIWSAFALLGSVLGRKVWLDRNYFVIHPNIYVALVGTAGSGKSTAKSIVKNLFVNEFPDFFISDSIQSREDIAMKMALPECVRTWKDETGRLHEYRPFFLIVNELSNFLSVDTRKMVDFLVDIFDENYFSTGFKTAISQKFTNPYVSMLACVQPTWIMGNLKMDLFSGGLGRRLILVFQEKTALIPEPYIPSNGHESWRRCIHHLKLASKIQGRFLMSDGARKWWNDWYRDPKRINREDPILMQFHETKHVILTKVAMLVALDEQPFRFELTDTDFMIALKMLDELEPRIVRLTSGVGRNELAGIAAQLMETLHQVGGAITEKKLQAIYFRHLQPREFVDVLMHLQKIDQIQVGDLGGKRVILLPERYEALRKEQENATGKTGN